MAKRILFIVMDHMRADLLTGALAGHVNLPNLRAFMADAATFTNHFSVTVPCGPARASLLTGLYAMNHRSVRNGTPLSRDHTNLALELRRAGTEPLLFGYTDTSADPRGLDPADPALRTYEGLLPGFEEIVRMRFETSNGWLADLRTKGYDLPDLATLLTAGRTADMPISTPTLYRAEDSDTAWLTNQTLGELATRTDQSWLAHVTYIRPHPPFAAPDPYAGMYAPAALPLPDRPDGPAAERALHPFCEAYFSAPSSPDMFGGFDGRPDRLSDADTQALRAVYLGLATEVDHHIGRLMAFLRDSGLWNDTLVIVTSDHGEMLGDHYMWGKDSVFDPAYHVPLIIRDPHAPESSGTRTDAFTESIDLAPTILDWLGQPPAPGMNGRSLLPLLRGDTPANWRDHVFAEIDLGGITEPTRFQQAWTRPAEAANAAILRETRWKLVHFNGGLPPLLFDLATDPGEHRNLAPDPAHADTLLRLTRKMLDHRMTHAHHALSRMELTETGVVSLP